MQFKVGDRVRLIKADIVSKKYEGQIGTVCDIWDDGYPEIMFDNGMTQVTDDGDILEKIDVKGPAKVSKPRPIHFILIFEPYHKIEEFETIAEVKDRVKSLAETESSLVRDSIFVYEIKKKNKVSIETRINLK